MSRSAIAGQVTADRKARARGAPSALGREPTGLPSDPILQAPDALPPTRHTTPTAQRRSSTVPQPRAHRRPPEPPALDLRKETQCEMA